MLPDEFQERWRPLFSSPEMEAVRGRWLIAITTSGLAFCSTARGAQSSAWVRTPASLGSLCNSFDQPSISAPRSTRVTTALNWTRRLPNPWLLRAQLSSTSSPTKDRFSKGRQWNGLPVRDTAVLHPHSDIAQVYWASVLDPADTVVDATCGNGYDTLFLAKELLKAGGGTLVACDIQQYAIEKTQQLMESKLEAEITKLSDTEWKCKANEAALTTDSAQITIQWKQQSHLDLMESFEQDTVKIVVFNLGYLPGGDKAIVTMPEVTLKTIAASQAALQAGGAISVTCYPGHEEGVAEEESILTHVHALPCEKWSCYYHQWINQRNKRTGKPAPSLVLIQKL